jgi:putative peptidoglycan lipid II flippase
MPNVARASGIMMASLLLSRVLGIGRDMIIAWRFGGREEMMDAYTQSFAIPDLIFFLVAGGALSSAFIPVFSEYLHTQREDEAWSLFGSITTIMSIFLVVAIGLTFIFAESLVPFIAPGTTPPEMYPIIAEMSRIVLPAQFAFFIGGLMFGTLYSRGVFSVPGLAPNVYNLGIIFGALVISNFVVPAVSGMSWGALIGATFGNLLIPIYAMWKTKSRFKLGIDWKHPGVKKVFRLMLPVVLGLSLPGVFGLLLKPLADFYPVPGLVYAMDLANKVMQAPLGVFGQSLALAAFPALAQFFAQQNMSAYQTQLAKSLRTVLFLSVPVSVLLFVAPEPLMRVIFEYGSFEAATTDVVANCLRTFAIGVFAWCMHPMLMRAFFAIQKTVTPIVLGTITTAIFLTLAWGSIQLGLPYPFLPLSGSVAAIIMALMLSFRLNQEAGPIDFASVVKTFLQSLGAAALAAVPFVLILWLLPNWDGVFGRAGFAVVVVVGSLIFAWLYYFAARALKMPETDVIRRAMNRREGKQDS